MTVAQPSRRTAEHANGAAASGTAGSAVGACVNCVRTGELGPGDQDALLDFFARSSQRTRHDRFHQALSVMPQRYLDDILSRRQFALTARDICHDVEYGRVVGMASAAQLTPEIAEVAIWVVDSWQRTGVGTLLTKALLEALAARGVRRAIGIIEPDNVAVRRLLARVAPQYALRQSEDLLVAEIPLPGNESPG